MAKIVLNGEVFDFDQSHRPMSEALALEAATGQRYADWEAELAGGSAKALCAFCWLVWRRNGRDVPLEDILSGAVEIDLAGLMDSLAAVAAEQEPGPTVPAAPAPTPSTPPATLSRSPRSTTSGPGR